MTPSPRPKKTLGKITDEQINARYLEMLPLITMIARKAFASYNPEKQEEAIQNAQVWALVNLRYMAENGKFDEAKASPLAWYAVKRHRTGRTVGTASSSTDVMSEYCQILGRSKIKYYQPENGVDDIFHSESVKRDARCPLDLTTDLKMDYEAWYHNQSPRDQDIIHDLSMGYTTSEVAKKFGVSLANISQKRRKYAESWCHFIDPVETACVGSRC